MTDTLALALALSLPPRATVNRVPALLPPPPAVPAALAAREARPETLATCFQGRSGSCWTEE